MSTSSAYWFALIWNLSWWRRLVCFTLVSALLNYVVVGLKETFSFSNRHAKGGLLKCSYSYCECTTVGLLSRSIVTGDSLRAAFALATAIATFHFVCCVKSELHSALVHCGVSLGDMACRALLTSPLHEIFSLEFSKPVVVLVVLSREHIRRPVLFSTVTRKKTTNHLLRHSALML